jgi:hypothetical protein
LATTSAVIRQLNSPESYLVYINENGWLNLGGNQWGHYIPTDFHQGLTNHFHLYILNKILENLIGG